MNKRETGKKKEELACKYLEGKGYHILETNYYCRYGEVDIIAREKKDIVFVEIKYRNGNKYGEGAEAVNHSKQRKLSMCMLHYLNAKELADYNLRFDVIGIRGSAVFHYQDAFCICF